MGENSENTVVETGKSLSPPTRDHVTEYAKYKFSRRLSHWKTRQDYLEKNIARMKERIQFHKKKARYYEEKLFEYESYMIVLNPVGDQITQVKDDAATRLQEAMREVENEDDSDSESDNDGDDNQSVMTCDTELLEMRETVAKRSGRR